jgi:hypothetical protein
LITGSCTLRAILEWGGWALRLRRFRCGLLCSFLTNQASLAGRPLGGDECKYKRPHHETRSEHGSGFAQKSSSASPAEDCVRSRTASERPCQTTAFAGLEQYRNHQPRTNKYVDSENNPKHSYNPFYTT